MTQNQINYWKLQEEKRANLAKEGETQRHNMTEEGLSAKQTVENRRHNIASENLGYIGALENQRHNTSMEAENQRHNIASENISVANVNLGYANVGLGYSQLSEQSRHNMINEIETQTNNEVLAAIKAYESETSRQKMYNDFAIAQGKLEDTKENTKIRRYELAADVIGKALSSSASIVGFLMK